MPSRDITSWIGESMMGCTFYICHLIFFFLLHSCQCLWTKVMLVRSWAVGCCWTGLTLSFSFLEIWRGSATRRCATTRRPGRCSKTSQPRLSDNWNCCKGWRTFSHIVRSCVCLFFNLFRIIFGRHTLKVRNAICREPMYFKISCRLLCSWCVQFAVPPTIQLPLVWFLKYCIVYDLLSVTNCVITPWSMVPVCLCFFTCLTIWMRQLCLHSIYILT